MTGKQAWERFNKHWCACPEAGLSVDVSRMTFGPNLFAEMAPRMHHALEAMQQLEGGAIANPDEQRMVGHYWLRNPKLAPNAEIQQAITACLAKIKAFATAVREGVAMPPLGKSFQNILLVGIGGSALGPQFVDDALRSANDPIEAFFCDNTDPDGIDRLLSKLSAELSRTLTIVISKSGGTKETRNGMLEIARGYEAAGLPFARHAVAVTSEGSALHKHAKDEGWVDVFPMWDWVGGRTSQLSAVGLLPAALQGFNIDELLEGARLMDECTRGGDAARNPAALLAMMWYDAARRGKRDMVIIPYKDRLGLLSRYLQQLIMESLGKENDLAGKAVYEGFGVYGNKGSTDQHAYVQQLRDGLKSFFVTFVEVLHDREGMSMEVEPGVTSGDYLGGFLLGTRAALSDKERESITITVDAVTPRSVGALIALFERAVGYYASLVNINAYHQPGVEAGKKAASDVIDLQRKLLAAMAHSPGNAKHAAAWAEAAGAADQPETAFKVLCRLAANPGRGVERGGGKTPADILFRATPPNRTLMPPPLEQVKREGA